MVLSIYLWNLSFNFTAWWSDSGSSSQSSGGITPVHSARECGTGWLDVGYKCGQGEGDCDWDSDCLPGLVCDFDAWFDEDDCVAGKNKDDQ